MKPTACQFFYSCFNITAFRLNRNRGLPARRRRRAIAPPTEMIYRPDRARRARACTVFVHNNTIFCWRWNSLGFSVQCTPCCRTADQNCSLLDGDSVSSLKDIYIFFYTTRVIHLFSCDIIIILTLINENRRFQEVVDFRISAIVVNTVSV